MSFIIAMPLIRRLEGGKWNDPGAGPTNTGMTQTTWQQLGFSGSVLDASDDEIDAAYWKLWNEGVCAFDISLYPSSVSVFKLLPPPADAVGFQFFVNVGAGSFICPLQGCLGVHVDGIAGPKTRAALTALAAQGDQSIDVLCQRLLNSQTHYYASIHSPYEKGLMERVATVSAWLRDIGR